MIKYYPFLHTLRGFAAIWVMLFHLWFLSGAPKGFFSPFFNLGWLGVLLFYILSAFLLGGIYFTQKNNNNWNIKTFYKKRFLRIFPAYYAQLLILIILGYFGLYNLPETKNLLAHLFMFFHLPPAYVAPLNGVWWTLPIEFGFYLLLPLLAGLLKKINPWIFLLVSFLITIAYRYWVFVTIGGQSVSISNPIGQLPGRLIVFSIGLSFSYILYKKPILSPKYKVSLLSLFGIFVWSFILLSNLKTYWAGNLLLYYWESITSLLLMVLIVSLYKTQNKILTNHIFIWFGKVSYGIYLWHLPVIIILKKYINDFLYLSLAVIPITLFFAFLSYQFIERKFSKL